MSSNPIIPAGELGAWRAWQPGALGSPPQAVRTGLDSEEVQVLLAAAVGSASEAVNTAPLPQPAPEAEPAEAAEALPALEEAALAVGYPTAAELEAIHQEAWQTGHEAGLAEGRIAGHAEGLALGREEGRTQAEAEVRARLEESWAPLEALVQDFSAGLAQLQSRLAPELLALALECAERLAGAHLQARPEALQALLGEALESLAGGLSQLRVRIHPDDAAALGAFLEREYPQTTVKWQPDPVLARGGCIIDTATSHIDLSQEARQAALRQALGLTDAADG